MIWRKYLIRRLFKAFFLFFIMEIELIREFDEYCSVCKVGLWNSWEGFNRYTSTGRRLRGEVVYHHTSYNPKETIIVCRKCHNKIHKTDQLPNLKPIDKTPKEWKKFLSDVFFIPDEIIIPKFKDLKKRSTGFMTDAFKKAQSCKYTRYNRRYRKVYNGFGSLGPWRK
jgi:hypothetical protein